MQINSVVIYVLLGLLAVTFIATIGAIASRKLKFNYSYLAFFSLVIYFLLGYFVSQEAKLGSVVLSSVLIGLFDSTVGWHLCLSFNANLGSHKEKSLNTSVLSRVIFVVLLSVVFSYLGYLITSN